MYLISFIQKALKSIPSISYRAISQFLHAYSDLLVCCSPPISNSKMLFLLLSKSIKWAVCMFRFCFCLAIFTLFMLEFVELIKVGEQMDWTPGFCSCISAVGLLAIFGYF